MGRIWCVMLFLCLGLTGCLRLPLCSSSGLQTDALRLRGIWNSTRRQQDPAQLKVWVHRLLSALLQGGAFQLEERNGGFVVIDPKESHFSRCRMSLQEQLKQTRDPEFLKRLYRLVKAHKVDIRKFLYKPPKTYVVQGDQSKVWGGDCRQNAYRVEASYWKAISGKYAKSSWPEACKIGRALKKWSSCFSPKFLLLYKRRMQKICR